MEQLHYNIDALRSLHRFGDELEDAILGIESSTAEFEVIRDAKDCIGRHWYGLRCRVIGKDTGISLYLHVGLIYYPSTRTGLMVELDEQNNQGSYENVRRDMKKRPEFEINREEPEYFKVFLPDERFEAMAKATRGEQMIALAQFVKAAGEAMLEAAEKTGFSITYQQMADALALTNAFDKALNEVKGDISCVAVNYQDKDNFGQYAQGFRYHLTDKEKTISLYAYFGVIYSYKKEPAGIFAEVDGPSNQRDFERVAKSIEHSPWYDISLKEPGFLKLFMKKEKVEAFGQAGYQEQMELLKEFLKACNDGMIKAGKKQEE